MRLNVPILILSAVMGMAGWRGLNGLMDPGPESARASVTDEAAAPAKVRKSNREWREALTPEQYDVMRQCGTEPAFSGAYNDFYEDGVYACAGCGTVLFGSETKYDHGTGWPSFWAARSNTRLEFRDDYSFLMRRTEVRCAACGAHLGHVFEDGPPPTGEHYCINSVALTFRPAGADAAARTAEPRTATFAAGCFWGVEYKFGELEGVLDTEAGYSGGTKPSPTYREVCSDSTGHAESVRITYDPSVVTYEQLVRFFFTIHDPTQIDRQGPDVGSQYRSVIFTHDDAQAAAARAVIAELEASGRFSKPLATRVVPAPEFFRAEEYHQRYYEKKGRG